MSVTRGPVALAVMIEAPEGAAGAEAPTQDEAAGALDPRLPTLSAQV